MGSEGLYFETSKKSYIDKEFCPTTLSKRGIKTQ